MPIEAVQYDQRSPVARFFHMRARMKHIVPVLARDTYVAGRGHMHAKLAGLFTVANARGNEFDEGELVTWLNDVVLFAPSMLLGPHTTWSAIDARSFGVAFSDRGRTVQARVSIDERGAPIDFETDHRYLRDPSDPTHALVRCRWSTPIESWHLVSGHPLPTRGSATWHLASGDYTYADFEPIPASFSLDVPPPPVVTCNDAVHCR